MAIRSIVAVALMIAAVLAVVGVFLIFTLNRSIEDREDASARRIERSAQQGDQQRETLATEVAQQVRLVGIRPSPRIVRLDAPGETKQLTVQGYYSDSRVGDLDDSSGAAVLFSSSDSSVADVDAGGTVTGLNIGGVDITVSYGDLTATVPVFVWGPMRAVPAVDPDRLLQTSEDGSAIVLNRVMVELESGYDANDAGDVASEVDGEVIFAFRTFPGYLVEFQGRTQQDVEEVLSILRTDHRVEGAYADMLISKSQGRGNGPSSIETLINAQEGGSGWLYLEAGMEDAWNTMNLVQNLDPVTIVVIDDRFVIPPTGDAAVDEVLLREFDHQRIYVKDAVDLAGRDVPWRDANSLQWKQHGVPVTSIIAARNNDRSDETVPERSFSGVVTSVDGIDYQIIFYQVEGGLGGLLGVPSLAGLANTAAMTAALEDITLYQDQIDVVNISLGHYCFPASLPCHHVLGFDDRWEQLMADMPQVPFVLAAGNAGIDAENVVPAKLSSVLPNVITVGGTLQDRTVNRRHPKSNHGSAITLGTLYNVLTVYLEEGRAYREIAGTSYSAPLVTGTVALLRSLDPHLSPREIKSILVDTGESHPVCNSVDDPCPVEKQDRWSFLDAGEAVSALLWPSVDAEVDLPEGHTFEATLGDYVEIAIPVVNSGSKGWNFRVSTVAELQDSDHKLELSPVQNFVPAGQSHPFKVGFSPGEVGRWTLEVKIHRTQDMTSTADSKLLLLDVAPAAESATAQSTVSAETGTEAATHAAERAILVELYWATNGRGWTKDTNWLSDRPLYEWFGVDTDDRGRVTALSLSHNWLNGKIPSELGSLSSLNSLDLYLNQLSGEIPSELGSLSSLEVLNLGGNRLSGEIPSELGSLSSLNSLILSFNRLSGEIPSELGSLSSLNSLILSFNRLSGEIPSELGSLSSLNSLILGDNRLSGEIPSELGALSSLEVLGLGGNQLSGEIPSELGAISSLTMLVLGGNQLSGEIPSELGALSSLTMLVLEGNQLSGEIPSELGALSSLNTVALGGNQLSGCVPEELTNVPWNDFWSLDLDPSYCQEPARTRPVPVRPTPTYDLAATIEAAVAAALPTATPHWPDRNALYDFSIEFYQGQNLVGSDRAKISHFAGKPLVLHFFGGLCPPCPNDLEDVQAVVEAHGNDIHVLGVDIGLFFDLGDRNDAVSLLSDLRVTFPVGYTADLKVVEKLGVRGLPTTFFITEDGELYHKWEGLADEKHLAKYVGEMLRR